MILIGKTLYGSESNRIIKKKADIWKKHLVKEQTNGNVKQINKKAQHYENKTNEFSSLFDELLVLSRLKISVIFFQLN